MKLNLRAGKVLAALSVGLGVLSDVAGGCACGAPECSAGDAGLASGGAGSKNLDEWLGYVAGDTLTRRMIVRQIGERAEGQSEAEYEQRLKETLLRRVLVTVMVWRARQFGLELKPDIVDEQVAEAAKEEEERAKKRGIPIPFAEILRRRGQSLEEFKDLLSRDILVSQYWRILTHGMPGKRPQLDPEPSPADCDAIYRAHRAAFDQQPGVRLAQFTGRPEDFLERTPDWDAAVVMAKSSLRAAAAEVAAGGVAEAVATAHGLKAGDWAVTPAGKFLEKGSVPIPPPIEAWAFDPARRRGDVEAFDVRAGAIAALAVVEVRPGRSRAYAEVLPDLMEMIRRVRTRRFQLQHMLEVLASAPVKPPQLIDAISDQLRDEQKRLDQDPVTRDIKMR